MYTTMTARIPRPSDQGLRRSPAIVGRASWSGKGSVPLIEPMPGRFHGPKISHRVSAVATKLRPRPPKISLTPPKVLSTPARAAHRAPPTMPASMARMMISAGERPVSCSRRSTQVVSTAPKHDLPLHADVPQPGREGDQHARRRPAAAAPRPRARRRSWSSEPKAPRMISL